MLKKEIETHKPFFFRIYVFISEYVVFIKMFGSIIHRTTKLLVTLYPNYRDLYKEVNNILKPSKEEK